MFTTVKKEKFTYLERNRNALRFPQVDAALDSGARRRVADWMEKSKLDFGTQFITTTFRRELMEKADKFIGVKHSNKVSYTHSTLIGAVHKLPKLKREMRDFSLVLCQGKGFGH